MKYRFRLGRRNYETNQVIVAFALLLPTFVALAVLFVYPVLNVFYLGFTQTNTITGISKFIGLQNYE